MTRRSISLSLLLAVSPLAVPAFLGAQTQGPITPPAAAPASTPASVPAGPISQGGVIHGTVMSGAVTLPGVAVTATNTLTGKKYSAATSITGAYSLAIPQNGRYVVGAELAAFAAS